MFYAPCKLMASYWLNSCDTWWLSPTGPSCQGNEQGVLIPPVKPGPLLRKKLKNRQYVSGWFCLEMMYDLGTYETVGAILYS